MPRTLLCAYLWPKIWITHVNNSSIDPPALIYGTPSFALPYGATRSEYQTFPAYTKYLISKKWNGTNVSFFKYPGPSEETFISAKPRSQPFVSESTPTSIGSHVRRLLGASNPLVASSLPALLAPLSNRKGTLQLSCRPVL